MAFKQRENIILKSDYEIEVMGRVNRHVAEVLDLLSVETVPGVSTAKLNQLAEDYISSIGGQPAFKMVPGYNHAICASINEEVVHGIPTAKRILREGDILSVDVGIFKDGFMGDAARTFPVGRIDAESQRLMDVTQAALDDAIACCVVGNKLSDIGHAVQQLVERSGFAVVRDYVGHGIGRTLHEEPQVPNFGIPGHGPVLKKGMVLAIEPMVNIGTHKVVVLRDGWTVVTKDRSRSAHFEHTIAITGSAPMVLSRV